jgi:uncharacterized membrane protein
MPQQQAQHMQPVWQHIVIVMILLFITRNAVTGQCDKQDSERASSATTIA